MYDVSDANPHFGPFGELIPDGTFAKLQMKIKPGNANGLEPADNGLLTASTSSNVKYLACEFEVVAGEFKGRKFWENLTIQGGKTDKNGNSIGWNMAKNIIRGMIDSTAGLNPDDKSPEANAKRRFQSFSQLQGITFAGRIQVEPQDNDYPDKNKLANCIYAGDERYAAIMQGENIAPDPINAKPRKGKAEPGSQQQAGGWQQDGGGSTSGTGFTGGSASEAGFAGSGAGVNGQATNSAASAAEKPGWM